MASLKRPCVFRCEIFRTLFSLPKDEEIRRTWLEFIFGTQDFPNKHVYVCDRHFSEDCLDNLGQFERGFCSKLYLAVGSIPTIKPGTSHESPGEAEAGTSESRSVGARAIINPVLRSSGVQTINTPVRSIGVHTSIINSRNVSTQLSAGQWKVFSARSKGVQARVCKSDKATQTDQEPWLDFSSTPIKAPMEQPSKRPRLEEEVDEQTEESMDISEHLPHDSTYDPAASATAASTQTSLSDISGLTEKVPSDLEDGKYLWDFPTADIFHLAGHNLAIATRTPKISQDVQLLVVKEEAPWIQCQDQQDPQIKVETEDLQINQGGEQLHGLTANHEEEKECCRFSLIHVVVKSEDELEEEEENKAESSQTQLSPPTSSSAGQIKTEGDEEDCDGDENTEQRKHLPITTDRKEPDSSETDDDDEWHRPLLELDVDAKSCSRVHSGEKPFVCDFCGKGFTIPGDLKRHTRVHTGEKPFSCDVCGKSFQHQWNLKTHTRVHTGEKPFNCGFCGKSFTQRVDLKRHMRVHTGEKPFVCDFCGLKFTGQGDLKRHIRIHTGEKPFSCDVCGTTFRHQCNLKTHMRVHTGEKPFDCAFCGKSFTRQVDLKRHMRVHTGEKLSSEGLRQSSDISINQSVNTQDLDSQTNPNP